jgi:hypothetical protein
MVRSVVPAALVLTLAACGGGDDRPDRPMPDLDSTPEFGPIEQLWQDAYAEVNAEDSRDKQMRVEELVAQCMSKEGFEYTPVDYGATGSELPMPTTDDGETLASGTLEYAELYGYGITTNPWADSAVPGPAATAPVSVDPNQGYLDSMTESEAAAYQAALHGVQPDFTDDEDWENWNPTWEEQGCYGSAGHEVYGDQMGNRGAKDEWAELEAEIEIMWSSVETDSRVAGAVEDWTSCMADAGHPGMATVQDAENLISDEVNAVYDDFDPYADLDEDATPEDYAAADAAVQERLAEITPEEISLAVADYTCRGAADYQRIRRAVSVDLQQEFYDAHKAELEAYAEWTTTSFR